VADAVGVALPVGVAVGVPWKHGSQ
jgi:hypothetical protein